MDDAPHLRALLDLGADVDDLVESALQNRLGLADTMATVLPKICEATGARAAFLRSFSEELELATFAWPDGAGGAFAGALEKTGPGSEGGVVVGSGEDVVVAQPLDVAGEWFGSAGIAVPRAAGKDTKKLAELLDIACEELDNYLYSIRAARERHRVLMALGDALKHRVLGEGLSAAVRVLSEAVPLDRLLLVCVAEEGAASLRVQVYDRAKLVVDTMAGLGGAAAELDHVEHEGRGYLRHGEKGLLLRYGFEGAQEEVLINGVTQTAVVGKVLVTARSRATFNTYDREVLAGFAGFIRQRVVDFNKEWRTLARSFRPDDVARLLEADDYGERFLAPREETVGILYVDIAGFTALSEQVLRTPSAVAALVEAWSREAVELVWAHGGVFDKMVGDCVIALFGPPFYEEAPGQRLVRALRCAKAIREMTNALPQREGLEMLRESGLAVSTGVNLAPLFVGRFGPNDNFTGFSSGMNNTARLQGLAARDEIAVMEDGIASLPEGSGLEFGEQKSAKVKNVAEPLRYRALK